jgi:hypothetical protein
MPLRDSTLVMNSMLKIDEAIDGAGVSDPMRSYLSIIPTIRADKGIRRRARSRTESI